MALLDHRSESVPLLNFIIGAAIAIDAANDPDYYADDTGEPMATAAVLVMLSIVAVWAIAGAVIAEYVHQRRLAARATPAAVPEDDDVRAPVMIRE